MLWIMKRLRSGEYTWTIIVDEFIIEFDVFANLIFVVMSRGKLLEQCIVQIVQYCATVTCA